MSEKRIGGTDTLRANCSNHCLIKDHYLQRIVGMGITGMTQQTK